MEHVNDAVTADRVAELYLFSSYQTIQTIPGSAGILVAFLYIFHRDFNLLRSLHSTQYIRLSERCLSFTDTVSLLQRCIFN